MRTSDRELWLHITKCLGIEDRKLRRMELVFEVNEVTVIKTEEFILNADVPEVVEKRWELKEVDNGDSQSSDP